MIPVTNNRVVTELAPKTFGYTDDKHILQLTLRKVKAQRNLVSESKKEKQAGV